MSHITAQYTYSSQNAAADENAFAPAVAEVKGRL
jgi:hypothetical protein